MRISSTYAGTAQQDFPLALIRLQKQILELFYLLVRVATQRLQQFRSMLLILRGSRQHLRSLLHVRDLNLLSRLGRSLYLRCSRYHWHWHWLFFVFFLVQIHHDFFFLRRANDHNFVYRSMLFYLLLLFARFTLMWWLRVWRLLCDLLFQTNQFLRYEFICWRGLRHL